MDITFDCSQCGASLHAPAEAAGRRVRCPACKEVSQVPDLDTLLGDSIAGMLMEEVEQELDDRHAEAEAALKKAAEEKARAEAERQKAIAFEQQRLAAEEKAAAPDIQVIQTEPQSRTLMTEHPKLKYPTRLNNDKARPYLIVTAIDENGVRFAFDSRWLKHERFSMSMPRICVHTGQDDQTKLVARPVVFEEHLSPLGPAASDLWARQEVKRIDQKTDRRVLIRMGPIEDAKNPFGHALACYVVGNRPGGLRGFTHQRPGGGITCEVVVPNADAALAWLGRVNGACGPEYELLENTLNGETTAGPSTSSTGANPKDPLATLDPQDRKALAQWCTLMPREKVLAFFPDSETQDAPGEAGLAVTNKRLVFKKYNRQGHAELKEPGTTLIGRVDGNHIRLVLVTSNTRHKLVALEQRHFEKLKRFLQKHTSIRVQQPQDTAESAATKPVKQEA